MPNCVNIHATNSKGEEEADYNFEYLNFNNGTFYKIYPTSCILKQITCKLQNSPTRIFLIEIV